MTYDAACLLFANGDVGPARPVSVIRKALPRWKLASQVAINGSLRPVAIIHLKGLKNVQ